jgi:hypothetical protein
MPIRRRHKVGDWLVTDDESGIVHYRSEVTERWDGLYVRRDQYETRQPQEFVKAKTDPKAVKPIRPDGFVRSINNNIPNRIGLTDVLTPKNGPAAHLFSVWFKIGPTGFENTSSFGLQRVSPSGSLGVGLSGGGIASSTAFGSHQVTEAPDGFNPVIGTMEIGPTFEVF